ncbi:MAG: hypothetical protein ACRDON_01845 [Gaiellaceae bacterium]
MARGGELVSSLVNELVATTGELHVREAASDRAEEIEGPQRVYPLTLV